MSTTPHRESLPPPDGGGGHHHPPPHHPPPSHHHGGHHVVRKGPHHHPAGTHPSAPPPPVVPTFTVLGQKRDLLSRSSTVIEDVMQVLAETHPSSVTFQRAIDYDVWAEGNITDLLQPIVANIEGIMHTYPVLSGAAQEQIDQTGALANLVEFVVQIKAGNPATPGTMQTTVSVPVQDLFDLTDFSHYFTPIIDALEKTATL